MILKSRSKKAPRHKSVLAVQGRKQRRKKLGSRVALLSRLSRLVMRHGFAHFVWKVFARRKLLFGKFWGFAPLGGRKKKKKKLIF